MPGTGSEYDAERTAMKLRPYRRVVGSLLWLARCTRPDLAFTASMLSTVSFRKGSCTALAPQVNAQQLMLHADHATIESTFQYYKGSFDDRRRNTQRLSAEFPEGF